MEISSVGAHVSSLSAEGVPRALPGETAPAAGGRSSLVEFNRASDSSSLSGFVDRIRAEFAFKKYQAESPGMVSNRVLPAQTEPGHAGRGLNAAMDRAYNLQTELFKTSIGWHVAISAANQSQSGVKTLLEKA